MVFPERAIFFQSSCTTRRRKLLVLWTVVQTSVLLQLFVEYIMSGIAVGIVAEHASVSAKPSRARTESSSRAEEGRRTKFVAAVWSVPESLVTVLSTVVNTVK